MDDHLKQYREMISLRGLTNHTIKSYSAYMKVYLTCLSDILHRSPEDVSNSRIMDVTDKKVTFSVRGRKPGEPRRIITLDNTEFIRRYLMHVLPAGFQKIRYYGFLNNRSKSKNLKLIFTIQGYQRFRARYTGLSMAELIKKEYDDTNPLRVFQDVYQVIADRKAHPKEGSYTNYLFDKGIDKILKKVGEECTEIVIAAKNPDKEEIKYEISDFLYHAMVLMVEKGVTWEDITRELARR